MSDPRRKPDAASDASSGASSEASLRKEAHGTERSGTADGSGAENPDAQSGVEEAPQPTTDIVASTLARLRAANVSRETSPDRAGSKDGNRSAAGRSTASSRRSGGDRRSGAWPDERDPQTLARSVDGLIRDQGWQNSAAIGSLISRWVEIVGPQVSDHCTPASFDPETRRLTLQAESTAWKTQLQLMMPLLRERIDATVGRGIIADITIEGPKPPRRYKGPGRISGRGPRDTWG